MSKGVVIKSNRYGISLVLDEKMPFSELSESVREQFQKSKDFFKSPTLAVCFRNRVLSEQEQAAMIRIIKENTSAETVKILEEEAIKKKSVQAEKKQPAPDAAVQQPAGSSEPSVPHAKDKEHKTEEVVEQGVEANAEFYKGNLRSGQVLKCASHVTLVGDVNPGATIISNGSIMILGSLKGTACAGAGGDNRCFIYALEMNPLQLQIGSVIAKRPDREKEKRVFFRKAKEENTHGTAMIAAVSGETISLETVSKEVLSKISM